MHLRDAEPGTLLRVKVDRFRAVCCATYNEGRVTSNIDLKQGDIAWFVGRERDGAVVVKHPDGRCSGWGEGVQNGMWEIVDAQDAAT